MAILDLRRLRKPDLAFLTAGSSTKKAVVLALAALVVLLAVAGGGDVYAYNQRTSALERQWKDAEAAGVPHAKIDPLRADLARAEAARGGTVPYAVTSLALVRNPVSDLQARTQKVTAQATQDSRGNAEAALTKLQQDYAPTHFDAAPYQRKLQDASSPLQLQNLARAWRSQDAWLVGIKQQLGAKAGGLSGGLPTDIVTARDQTNQTVAQLRQASLWTDPADQALSAAQRYLSGDYPSMLSQHDAVARELSSARDTTGTRLKLHATGTSLVASLPALVPYGDANTPAQVDQAQKALQAAHDDGHLQSAVNGLQGIVTDLRGKKQDAASRLAAGTTGCESNASGRAILISISAQRLVACDGTTAAYSSLITTGRDSRGVTPTGTFSVSFKQSPWLMKPDPGCQQDQPCWYKPTNVQYVMLFKDGGYFIHDWPPQEGSRYGPGTQNGQFGSHGCVHVPVSVLAQLYQWTPVGTTVVISG
ncbi:MAG: L,D-transpeptidase [Candidatus Dormibacteraeota bacterium]|nr:L,D-transpeptidase [Candidatus Dormibacteraeota bacterium]